MTSSSSVSIVSILLAGLSRVWNKSHQKQNCFCFPPNSPDRLWGHPASCTMDAGVPFWAWSGRCTQLTTCVYLVPRRRITGATPVHPFPPLMARTRWTVLYFYWWWSLKSSVMLFQNVIISLLVRHVYKHSCLYLFALFLSYSFPGFFLCSSYHHSSYPSFHLLLYVKTCR
jgi:hypothetical protein